MLCPEEAGHVPSRRLSSRKAPSLKLKGFEASAKLENRWSNPMVIARFLTRVTVRLTNPDTGVLLRKAHVSQLKRYFPAE
jgi:hypothetical protein